MEHTLVQFQITGFCDHAPDPTIYDRANLAKKATREQVGYSFPTEVNTHDYTTYEHFKRGNSDQNDRNRICGMW